MEIAALVTNNITKTNSNMNCQNCGTKLSCGCQKRTATDGKDVCSSCLNTYENNLTKQKAEQLEQLKIAAMNAASQK